MFYLSEVTDELSFKIMTQENMEVNVQIADFRN